jgi:hypothetical protein
MKRLPSCAILLFKVSHGPSQRFELFYSLKDGIFLATEKLQLDLEILMAVDRFTTGASAHSLRGLANAYVLACESAQPTRAEEYRTRLLREPQCED